MNIGVSEKHGAHIVVRESVKLLIQVVLLWVRCVSRTMHIVHWVLKDGESGGLWYTVYVCMQTGSGAVVNA